MQGSSLAPLVGMPGAGYDEIVRDIQVAKRKGSKHIELTYFEQGSVAVRISGCDVAKVAYFQNSATRTQEANVRVVSGECVFIPDPVTGFRIAEMLDTPYNRKILATHLIEKRWTIEDPQIEKEIEELSKTIEQTVDTSVMHQPYNSQPVVRPEQIAQSLTPEQKKIRISEMEKEIEELKKGATAEKKKDVKTVPEAPTGQGEEFVKSVRDNVPPEILTKAVETVHARKAGKIDELKRTYGKFTFTKSKDYIELIQPEIDQEIRLAMGN